MIRDRANRLRSIREPNEHLRTVANSDGAAILNVDKGVITTLNGTGAYVWERLQRKEPLDKIVVDLARETSHDPAVVRQDVYDFASCLEKSL